MILSVSTELVSAKAASAQDRTNAVSDVSETSSTAVPSTEKSISSVTVVAESTTLQKVKVPTGLKGAGTKANPYQIGTIDDLLRMNSYINYEASADKYFVLTADIDLSLAYFPALDSKEFAKKSDFVSQEGIYSIVSACPSLSGNANVYFRLDGNGYAFKNMNVTVPAGVQAAGLFGYVGANSAIENVSFKNCRMTVNSGCEGAYALIAVQNLGTIRKVDVTDCVVDARQSEVSLSEAKSVMLDCGKVCKGIALVTSENSGSVSSVQVQSSDANHGVFVQNAVSFVGAVAGQNRASVSEVIVSGVRILCYGAKDGASSIAGNGDVAQYVGMIAGANDSANAKKAASITDCSVRLRHGSDLLFGDYVGGIAGLNTGTVTKSSVIGSCSDSSDAANIVAVGRVGAILGDNSGSVESCGAYDVGFSFGKASSQNVYGGVVGENTGTVQRCVASGYARVADSKDSVGGIVGLQTSGTVSENYSFISVSQDTATSGAILGKGGTFSALGNDNYWIGSEQGFSAAAPSAGANLNVLQADMPLLNIPAGAQGTSFSGSVLSYAWHGSHASVALDLTAPVKSDNAAIHVDKSTNSFTLSSRASGEFGSVSYAVKVTLPGAVGTGKTVSARVQVPVLVTDSANKGAGLSVSNPIVLSSYAQFRFIRIAPSAHYCLDADITIGDDWTPVAFSGTLDGAGHSITTSRGLFSVVSGSRDDRVSAADWATSADNMQSGVICDLVIHAKGAVRGSLFGSADNATLDKITYAAAGSDDFVILSDAVSGALTDVVSGNMYLHNCYVSVPITVTASSSDGIGALVGQVSADVLRMDNCGASSVIALDGHNLSKVGGLIGYVAAVADGAVTNCYASGSVYVKPAASDVKARIMIGGIAAAADKNLKTENCYFSVAESAVQGGSVATDAADRSFDGIISLSASQETYRVDPDGNEETEIVVSLPQELDACRDVQAKDFSFVFENEDLYISSEADTSGSDVTFGVMMDADAQETETSTLTVIHEPTGLIITDVMTAGTEPGQTTYDGETYRVIDSLDDLLFIQDDWSHYSSANLLLTKDIVVGAYNDGTTPPTVTYGTSLPMLGDASEPFTGKLVGADATNAGSTLDINGDGQFSIMCASFSQSSSSGTSDSACALFPYTDNATFENFSLDYIQVTNIGVGTGVLVGIADIGVDDYSGSGNATSFKDITISHCSVSSTRAGDDDGEGGPLHDSAANTVQIGALAGALRGGDASDPYLLTNITISDTSVTDTASYAYGIGAMVGVAYCTTGTAVYIGGTPYEDTDPETGDPIVLYTNDPVVLQNVTVSGYGSVGGAVGMAGNWPEDADSDFRHGYYPDPEDIPDPDYLGSYLGSLYILNVSLEDGSSLTASAGVCGGIVGSELAGFPDNENGDYGEVLISACTVEDSTIVSNAAAGSPIVNSAACGGIAGYCGGKITGCSVTDSTIKSVTAGGIVGKVSRKDFKVVSGNEITVENCNVLGTTQVTNPQSVNALYLGGIISSVVNANATVMGCGVGSDAEIGGAAKYVGGLIGFVYSDDTVVADTDTDANDNPIGGTVDYPDPEEYLKVYSVLVANSVFAGSAAATTVSDRAVGGCIGYAEILPGFLCVRNNFLGGSLDNSGYCAGIIGQYSTTDVAFYPASEWIVYNVVAAEMNSSALAVADTTCYLIALLGDAETMFLVDSAVADYFYGNMVSSYPTKYNAFGTFAYSEDLGYSPTIGDISGSTDEEQTYVDINRPDDSGYNDPDAAFSHGDTLPFSFTNEDTDPTLQISEYNLIKTMGMSDCMGNHDYGDFFSSSMEWAPADSDVTILEVDDSGFDIDNSAFDLPLTGLSNSGDASDPAHVVGQLHPGYLDANDEFMGFMIPGTMTPVSIPIAVPVVCSGFGGSVTWNPESDPWMIINSYERLNDVRNRIGVAGKNQNYKVTADIDIGDGEYATGTTFQPIIGANDTAFSGQFKCGTKSGGGYYTISGWSYSGNAASVGLFARAENAKFTDVSLSGCSLTTSGARAGALVGTASGAPASGNTFSNIMISNSTISASEYAGAVAAYATNVKTDGVTLSGNTVIAQKVGGVFGRAAVDNSGTNFIKNATVTNLTAKNVSYANNNVADIDALIAGGIAGEFSGLITAASVSKTSGNSVIRGGNASGVVGATVGNTEIGQMPVSGDPVAGATVTGLSVTSNGTTVSSRAGGIVGENATGTLSVHNSSVQSTITSGAFTGGIVGYTSNLAGLTIKKVNVGGTLTGPTTSSIASISAVGGLIGLADASSATANSLSNTVFHGTLNGAGSKGGAIGRVGDTNGSVQTGLTNPVTNFYYSSHQCGVLAVTGSGSFTSTTYKDLQDVTVFSYSHTTSSGVTCTGKTLNFINYTGGSTYTLAGTWTLPGSGTYDDFTAPDSIRFQLDSVTFENGSSLNTSTGVLTITASNGDDPGVFAYTNGIEVCFTVHVSDIEGSGQTAQDPYKITKTSHLKYLREYNGAYFKLMTSLPNTTESAQDMTNWVSSEWSTSAWQNMTFTGHLDGNNCTITGFSGSTTTADNTGFFCKFNGELSNVTFATCSVTATTGNAGIVAGTVDRNGSLDNVKVSNSTVSGEQHVGGIAGVSFGTINDCEVTNNSGSAKTISATHSAGGILGGGFNATSCTVSGMTITAGEMAGGIAGGTLSYETEVRTTTSVNDQTIGWFDDDNKTSTYRGVGETISFDGATVDSSTSVTVNKGAAGKGYVGGVLGIAEYGNGSNYRKVSLKSCSIESGVSVTANAASGYAIQNYAGGIVGYLDCYHSGLLIENCVTAANVTANGYAGAGYNTSAGGLLGAAYEANYYKFRDSVSNPLTFAVNFNVVNGTITSAKYAGGLFGQFLCYTSNDADYLVKSGDAFICHNIIAPTFVTVAGTDSNSSGIDYFGVVAGLFKPDSMAAVMASGTEYTVISGNYYSSYVSCRGQNAALQLFGDGSLISKCGISDVATNAAGAGSFQVDNNDGKGYKDKVEGKPDESVTLPVSNTLPISLRFKTITGASTATDTSAEDDLGLTTNSVPIEYGSYTSRVLTLQNGVNATASNPTMYLTMTPSPTAGHQYYSATFSSSGGRYCSSFTVCADASQCESDTRLVADLGYGLLVSVSVRTYKGDGSTDNPYYIKNEKDFADYFFSSWSSTASNTYLANCYEQTADLNFIKIEEEISHLSGARRNSFAPIGASGAAFTGRYDGGGFRIIGFHYSGNDLNTGLFGCVGEDGELCNIHIELLENGVTSNLTGGLTGGVTGGNNTGALVGSYSSEKTIYNCSVIYGTVTANRVDTSKWVNVGGLVGESDGVSLQYCFTSTDVRTSDYASAAENYYYTYSAGGLVGYCQTGDIAFDRCFTSSDVVGAYYVGGFVGKLLSNEVDIQNCYSTASVTSLHHVLRDNNGDPVEGTRPVSLVTGYTVDPNNTSLSITSGDAYVSVQNMYVAGTNTSEYNGNNTGGYYYYVSLFGLLPTKSASGVYYDANVIGRLSVPGVGFLRVDGSLRSAANAAIDSSASNAAVRAMRKTTADLTGLAVTEFDDITVDESTTIDAADVWNTDVVNVYPFLNMADEYSDFVSKLSALPLFMDPREANDVDAERTYTGVTYPTSIAKTLDDVSLSIASSTYTAADEDDSIGTNGYPTGYDAALTSQTRTQSVTRTETTSNDNPPVTTVNIAIGYTEQETKLTDFLFKDEDNTTEYSILRNSYLDYGTVNNRSVPRDQKSPYVRVSATFTGEDDSSYSFSRAIRIPLRGEKNTVYVATERQLRAIMGHADEANKFKDAYEYVCSNGMNVLVCADIDLNDEISFTPISGYTNGAVGSTGIGFDGGNCVISNMNISATGSVSTNPPTGVGMFDTLYNSDSEATGIKIQNIILKDVHVSGDNYVGALVGYVASVSSTLGSNTNCLINNCMVISSDEEHPSTVTGTGSYVGGLIGYARGVMIDYTSNEDQGIISSGGGNSSYNQLRNAYCGANASVTGANVVGGFIGKIDTVWAVNCFATGNVTLNATTLNSSENAVGGFIGSAIGNDSSITYAFASGNVTGNAVTVQNGTASTNYNSVFGVGGFAGISQIPIDNCFSTGEVVSSVGSPTNVNLKGYAIANANYSLYHGIGGLIGYANNTAPVSNSYSASAVTYSNRYSEDSQIPANDETTHIGGVNLGVGGVVGYSGASVSNVYSSGSVDVPSFLVNNNGNDHYFGGAVGYASSATNAYFDLWTNHIVGLQAVGNLADSSGVRCSYTTDQFCGSSLVGNLPSSDWGCDPTPRTNGYVSNAYPYLKSFFGENVSEYVKFPAVLSTVAVRPNDRDSSARNGTGYSMALTMPTFVYIYVQDDQDHVVEATTYHLQWKAGGRAGDATDSSYAGGLIQYGQYTYAPLRTSNVKQYLRLTVWVKSIQPAGGSMSYGYYEKVPAGTPGAYQIVETVTDSRTQKTLSQVTPVRDTYIPRVGEWVKRTDGYKEYGMRSIRKEYRKMLGTKAYPYLISSVMDLKHIAFTETNGTPSSVAGDDNLFPDLYAHWYSPVNDNNENVSGKVYFRLISNVDMTKEYTWDSTNHVWGTETVDNPVFTAIRDMSENRYTGIGLFQGYELDGDDYAIVSFSSASPLIETLDAKSDVRNLIFDRIALSGTGDLALIGTNNGFVNGMMLMNSEDENHNGTTSVASTGGHAAGLVATNNGVIWESIAHGTITGASGKYVGGVAAVNNGVIARSVSAADVVASAGTLGAGGLVGQNNANQAALTEYVLSDSESENSLLVVANSTTIAEGAAQIHVSDVAPILSGNFEPKVGTGSEDSPYMYVKQESYSGKPAVYDSFSMGSVTTGSAMTAFTGGLVGENNGAIQNAYTRTAVTGPFSKTVSSVTTKLTGSFAGTNTATGSITDSFAAGTTVITGTAASSTGSAFVGTAATDSTLTRSYADKALLTSNTYMLVGDAEVTENIINKSCFNNSAAYTTASNAYPQLTSIRNMQERTTYKINNTDHVYTFLKETILKAYSNLSSVTVDTPAANYIDAIPGVAALPVTSITDYTISPASIGTSPASGTISATAPRIAQEIGAGGNNTDDLAYTPSFSFGYTVVNNAANPNFPAKLNNVATAPGTGTASDPYIIGTDSTYSAENSFASLAYFGKATDANFKMTTDVSYDGESLAYPITKLCGSVNGNGHTVNDLTLTGGGLFGTMKSGSSVRNLGLTGVKLAITPTAAGNYGLLANETYGATVENVFVVGELKVNVAQSSSGYATNVGGLIGYAEDSAISNVVTSGYIRNDSTVTDTTADGVTVHGATVGGVIGKMSVVGSGAACTLGAAESTAYVYGKVATGGIVGRETGNSAISNVIFAGSAADPYMTTYRTTGNVLSNDSAKISHILAQSDNNYVPTDVVKYDSQIALFEETKALSGTTVHWATATNQLAQEAADGSFAVTNAGDADHPICPYYANPVQLPNGVDASEAFATGLNFALARINVSLALSDGDISAYDSITVTSPVRKAVSTDVVPLGSTINGNDTVALTEDRETRLGSTGGPYMLRPSTTELTPNGGSAKGFTGVKATLNTTDESGATYQGNANTIYRYLEVNIVRVVDVSYAIVDHTGSLGTTTEVGLLLNPHLTHPVSSNAITCIQSDKNHDNNVRFRKLVVSGDTIGVQALLPVGYGYGASTSSTNYTMDTKSVTLGASDTSVTIYLHVGQASPTWGLQDQNGVVTPVR